jgi:hypothetical protein
VAPAPVLDFANLTPTDFEELCFDLLGRVGYLDLTWRQGGADQGRDIEATFDAVNPLLETIRERWYVQCKHYEGGVPPQPINDAVAWADAGRPQHLLYIVSSHVTNATRTWLEEIRRQKAYSVHVLEGKRLAELIVRYPDLVARYFFTEPRRLLRDAMNAWATFGILPSGRHLAVFVANLEPSELTREENAFMWVSSRHVRLETFRPPISFDSVSAQLLQSPTAEGPITPDASATFTTVGVGEGQDFRTPTSHADYRVGDPPRAGLYVATLLGSNTLLEVRYEANGGTEVAARPSDEAGFQDLTKALFELPEWNREPTK